jgi:hypothetical protein
VSLSVEIAAAIESALLTKTSMLADGLFCERGTRQRRDAETPACAEPAAGGVVGHRHRRRVIGVADDDMGALVGESGAARGADSVARAGDDPVVEPSLRHVGRRDGSDVLEITHVAATFDSGTDLCRRR